MQVLWQSSILDLDVYNLRLLALTYDAACCVVQENFDARQYSFFDFGHNVSGGHGGVALEVRT